MATIRASIASVGSLLKYCKFLLLCLLVILICKAQSIESVNNNSEENVSSASSTSSEDFSGHSSEVNGQVAQGIGFDPASNNRTSNSHALVFAETPTNKAQSTGSFKAKASVPVTHSSVVSWTENLLTQLDPEEDDEDGDEKAKEFLSGEVKIDNSTLAAALISQSDLASSFWNEESSSTPTGRVARHALSNEIPEPAALNSGTDSEEKSQILADIRKLKQKWLHRKETEFFLDLSIKEENETVFFNSFNSNYANLTEIVNDFWNASAMAENFNQNKAELEGLKVKMNLDFEKSVHLVKLINKSLECCNSSRYDTNRREESWCPPTWDGVMCWPATPPNTIMNQSCLADPETQELDPEKFAFTFCNSDGQWYEGKMDNKNLECGSKGYQEIEAEFRKHDDEVLKYKHSLIIDILHLNRTLFDLVNGPGIPTNSSLQKNETHFIERFENHRNKYSKFLNATIDFINSMDSVEGRHSVKYFEDFKEQLKTKLSQATLHATLLNKSLDCANEARFDPNRNRPGWCPGYWDLAMCWPATAPGTMAKIPCIDYYTGFTNTDGSSYKYCASTGAWFLSDTGIPWTWFMECKGNEYGKDYFERKMNKYEEDLLVSPHMNNITYIRIIGYTATLIFEGVALYIIKYSRISRRTMKCARNKLHIQLFLSFIFRAVVSIAKLVWDFYFPFVALSPLNDEIEPDLVLNYNQTIVHTAHKMVKRSLIEDPVEIPGGSASCQALTIVWQYFVSTNFNMVLVEALYLAVAIFMPFYDNNNIKRYILFGWIFPIPFVALWAVLRHFYDDVGCWDANNNEGIFWIIRGHNDFCVAVSFIIFVGVIYKLYSKMFGITARTVASQRYTYGSWVRSSLSLIPLFGVPYVIFTVAMYYYYKTNSMAEVFWLYADSSFSSFQGFFIAFLFCFNSKEVKDDFRKKWRSHLRQKLFGPSSPANESSNFTTTYPSGNGTPPRSSVLSSLFMGRLLMCGHLGKIGGSKLKDPLVKGSNGNDLKSAKNDGVTEVTGAITLDKDSGIHNSVIPKADLVEIKVYEKQLIRDKMTKFPYADSTTENSSSNGYSNDERKAMINHEKKKKIRPVKKCNSEDEFTDVPITVVTDCPVNITIHDWTNEDPTSDNDHASFSDDLEAQDQVYGDDKEYFLYGENGDVSGLEKQKSFGGNSNRDTPLSQASTVQLGRNGSSSSGHGSVSSKSSPTGSPESTDSAPPPSYSNYKSSQFKVKKPIPHY